MAKIFKTCQHCQQEYEVDEPHECPVGQAKFDPATAPMPNPSLAAAMEAELAEQVHENNEILDAILYALGSAPTTAKIGPYDESAARAAKKLGVKLTGEYRPPRDGEAWLWEFYDGSKAADPPRLGTRSHPRPRYIVTK